MSPPPFDPPGMAGLGLVPRAAHIPRPRWKKSHESRVEVYYRTTNGFT
jgi:hypothetical protein